MYTYIYIYAYMYAYIYLVYITHYTFIYGYTYIDCREVPMKLNGTMMNSLALFDCVLALSPSFVLPLFPALFLFTRCTQ